MAATSLLETLHLAGLTLKAQPDGGLLVTPASLLTPELRQLIRDGKAGLIEAIRASPTPCPAYAGRLSRFTDKGLSLDDAERLADKLVIRDRDGDNRRVCLECAHLQHGGRCGNWQAAGVAIRARDAQLPGDFTTMLQRCDGYQSAINSPIQSNG